VRRNRSVGIDIGSGQVKVVVLEQRGGKLHLAGLGAAELPTAGGNGTPPDPAAVARAIRNALGEAGARGVSAAMCALPRHGVAVRDLHLPGEPSEQLAQAAVLEATRTLPFPAGDAGTGVCLRPAAEGTTAQVAVARGEVVAAYRGAVQAANLRLDGLGVSSLAAGAIAPASEGAWVLVDIGAHATALDLFEDGVVRLGRTLLNGGEHLTRAMAADLGCDEESAEECKRAQGLSAVLGSRGSGDGTTATEAWLAQLVGGIRLLMSARAAQGPSAITGIRLAGGGGALLGLASYLEARLGVPVTGLEPELPLTARAENPLQYAAALGMALAHARRLPLVDLVAASTRKAKEARRRRTQLGVMAAVLVVALAWAGLWAQRTWKAREEAARHLAALADAASKASREADRLRGRQRALLTEVRALRSALKPLHPWVDVLNELAALAPEGVWLTGVELERGKPLVVRGTALKAEQAADFASVLAQSRLLEQAELSYANDAEINQRRVVQFGITALVRGNMAEARASATRRTTSGQNTEGAR